MRLDVAVSRFSLGLNESPRRLIFGIITAVFNGVGLELIVWAVLALIASSGVTGILVKAAEAIAPDSFDQQDLIDIKTTIA